MLYNILYSPAVIDIPTLQYLSQTALWCFRYRRVLVIEGTTMSFLFLPEKRTFWLYLYIYINILIYIIDKSCVLDKNLSRFSILGRYLGWPQTCVYNTITTVNRRTRLAPRLDLWFLNKTEHPASFKRIYIYIYILYNICVCRLSLKFTMVRMMRYFYNTLYYII